MAPKKKDHSNDLRSLVIKRYQNEDSQQEVSTKVLLPRETKQYIIRRYKETKCIGNVFGHVRKRHAEQISWILGNSDLVRCIKVQSFRMRWKSNDVAIA